MAVANSSCNREEYTRPCNSYKVLSLTSSILDANEISNLKDRYILGEQLGLGQFGVIRACTDKFTGEVLACKSISKDRLVTLDDVSSIKLEIEIMTRLSGHPNVVDLKAVYEEEEYVHLVMELCAGGELFHQLEKKGQFSESDARVLFRHLIQVVLYCHENGVVHRDLKPENILLATKSSSQIKRADFGLATYIKPGQKLHGLVGSPFYIAPGVLARGYNEATDVWSAGVILYILLSGMPPFWGKTKSSIFEAVRTADLRFPSDPWDGITESACDFIRGMLCKYPSKRLTAHQVLDHSWMRSTETLSKQPGRSQTLGVGGCDVHSSSFTTPFMSRSQDISFGTTSPSICEVQSPTFTCRSSFSPFLVEPSSPRLASARLSFCSNGVSNCLEFSSPVSSKPSFAFFSPSSMVKEGSCSLEFSTSINAVHQEISSGNLLLLSNSLSFRLEARGVINRPVEPKSMSCVEQCQKSGCVGEKCFQHCKFSSDRKPIDGPWYIEEPLYLRWKLWDCQTDCRYHCMLAREEERKKLGDKPVKYYGKWSFKRVYGIQEPVSFALSALNLAMQFQGWISFFILVYYKLPLRPTKKTYYEYTGLWHIWAVLSMNSWFWSSAFHSRDVELTERIDKSSAVALLGFTLILAILRAFNVRDEAARVMVCAPVIAFVTTHILYLNFYKLDSGLHMKVCMALGVFQLLTWSIWAGATRHPSRWKLWALVAGGSISMLLLIYDFPPYQGYIDAHAISIAITIPLTYLWWSFVKDDAELMTSALLKKAK